MHHVRTKEWRVVSARHVVVDVTSWRARLRGKTGMDNGLRGCCRKKILCDIFKEMFSLQTSKYTTFQKHQYPTHIKHLTTDPYTGLYDNGEEYCESDLNCLASVILRRYTTVTNQC